MSALGQSFRVENGRSLTAPPPSSDIDLFCQIEGVIDLNTEISDRAFDLGVAQ